MRGEPETRYKTRAMVSASSGNIDRLDTAAKPISGITETKGGR